MPQIPNRRVLAWRLLPLAALLGGCNATMPTALTNAVTSATTAASLPAGTAARGAVPMFATREASGLQSLFAKSTVTGADLIPELRAFKRLAGPGAVSMDQLMGNAAAAAPAAAGSFFGDLLGGGGGSAVMNAGIKLGMTQLESALKGAVMGMAFSELQGHLDFLIGDANALRNETITLPSARGLTPDQMQRAVTLAAIVVATRISARMLKQAQQDLAGLEQEYQTLIDRREKAAALLQQALGSSLPPAARGSFSEAELSYLRNLSASAGVGGFAKDMGAQTLALRLVAATDPKAFAEYKAQSEGLTNRQRALLRTVGGVVAFGGLLTSVGAEFAKMGKEQPFAEMIALGPLALAFLTEVPPVFQSAFAVVSEGAGSLVKTTRNFRVTVGARTDEVGSAADVFALLARNGAAPELQAALFRDDGYGLLNRVHTCDAGTAAQMLDSAVPGELRSSFAKESAQAEPERFSFVNGFAANPALAPELLARDHRPRLADRKPSMTAIQLAVAGRGPADDNAARPGYLKWNNDQLLRLVFANRDENAARYAMLEINGVAVRPVPSMQSLYAYETLANACRASTLPAAAPAPTTATKPPARPPAQQRPQQPPAKKN